LPFIGTVAIAAGLGGVIYSVVAPSSYHNKNPWANATLLDDKITRMINQQLSKPLLDFNGDPRPEHLASYVSFNTGEKDGIDIYPNLDNIKIIQEIFAKNNWIKNNLSTVETMLKGTGANFVRNSNNLSRKSIEFNFTTKNFNLSL